jgi:hypothetical protein
MRSIATVAVASLSLLLAACGGSSQSAARTGALIGPAGGVVSTASGLKLTIPAGALQAEVEIHAVEAEPQHGVARFELEPRDLTLAVPATVSVKMPAASGPMKLVEVEHGVETELETEHQNASEHSREAETHHLGGIELRHQNTCATPCGTGFECDDGACKAHVEDPAAPPADGNCPAGQELDVSDNVCKAHGGTP